MYGGSHEPARLAEPGRQVLGVGELMAGLSELLEGAVGRVWVAGEVSNLRRPASGHAYFTLKDEDAQLRSVLFRGNARRLAFDPEDGMAVLAYGELTIYEPRGDLQLIVRALEPRGEGALQIAFEQLRARLDAEGLFDPSLKRPLPERPRRVGIVTSETAAALHDVLRVAAGRDGRTPLLLAPTRVQGEGAAEEIAAALAAVAARPDVDVVLLVRGGGSLEDLQAFNHEAVARAVRACPVPVVCGVGHEIDVTIADLAADLRAPTPSAAAAAALPDRAADGERLAERWDRLVQAARLSVEESAALLREQRSALRMLAPHTRLALQAERLAALQRGLAREVERRFASQAERFVAVGTRLGREGPRLVEGRRGRFRTAATGLSRAGRGVLSAPTARLESLAARLDGLSPLAVLGRGYALVQREADEAIVRRPGDVAPGDALRIRLAEGEIGAEVTRPPSLPRATPDRRER